MVNLHFKYTIFFKFELNKNRYDYSKADPVRMVALPELV
jgi:hypothetical protein